VRAGDRSRERTVRRLRRAYVDGALSTGTFELRVASAYESRTGGDLRALLGDLPSPMAWARAAWDRLWEESPATACVGEVVLPCDDGAAILVGRSSRCDIVLSDPAVSRVHLEIARAGGRWQARDVASTNGTFVDGRRIGVTDVAAGDVLVLGDAAIRLAAPRGAT
jgi:hypothetical protein